MGKKLCGKEKKKIKIKIKIVRFECAKCGLLSDKERHLCKPLNLKD